MPKAELHMHIEGSLEPELIFALRSAMASRIPYASVEDLRRAYAFTNLQSFLDIYYAGASVLLKEQDFYDMAWAYLERAAADNVVRTEMFFDPQTHTARGVDVDGDGDQRPAPRACVDAQQAGRERGAHPVLPAPPERRRGLRDAGAGAALSRQVHRRRPRFERGRPSAREVRARVRTCRELGLHLVAHAGEEGPPAYVWSALDVLKVERIDHGVQSAKDPALMKRLAQDRIPLTVCPLSNLKLCVFPDLSKHNLGALLDAGLVATVNSDDPAYFGGYMNENFLQTFAATGLDVQHAWQLAANSFEGSFIDAAAKRAYVDRLNAVFAESRRA
jgi:adenosine deaminase